MRPIHLIPVLNFRDRPQSCRSATAYISNHCISRNETDIQGLGLSFWNVLETDVQEVGVDRQPSTRYGRLASTYENSHLIGKVDLYTTFVACWFHEGASC